MGGRDDSVAMLVMVIMIAMITQLPSTSHGMVMNNNTISRTTTTAIFTTSSSSSTAGNGTWCNGHISINGECLQLNIKKNINDIADDDVEGDELEFDMELKYAMMEMVDMYSETTTFITRFLAGGGSHTQGVVKHPDKPYCDQPGHRYTTECQGEGNGGNGENCKDIHKRNC